MKKLFSKIFIFLLVLESFILTIITKNFLFILIIILIIYIFILNNQIHKQKLEIKNLNYICDTTRTFRHDFSNIMQAIGGYIKFGDTRNLKIFFDNLNSEYLHLNNLCTYHNKLIEDSAIYNLIMNKYELAEKYKIKMNLNILSNLNDINFDSYHLSKVLGILLDNAIEASKDANNKIINLSIESNNSKQFIIIENTYFDKDISTAKIFQKGYTSKSYGSGIGLWETNNIIKKYKNVDLKTEIDDLFFTQKLEIS